jgi:DUF1680 family protein
MTSSAHAPIPPTRVLPSGRRTAPVAPVDPARTTLRPLGLDEVRITGGFWGERQQVNAEATLAHIEHWLEREGWLANFDRVVAGDLAGRRGREFSDSEIYKLLEAMAWELGRRPDPALAQRFERIVARVAAAQDADGYLSTMFGHAGQGERYSDLEWGHELYCQGHLIQAAVARIRTGHPDDLLVQVARRSADHICRTFGPDGIQSICGHAEIEVALAELGRATGEGRYLEQAALFVERHGSQVLADIEWGRSYYQDDIKVRDADIFRGHAVRANYLAAGATDVAVDTHDEDLLAAIVRQWRNTRARRTYLTGGQGSTHQDEAFGDDYYLPPDRAYSETCAAIASTMVSWRLLAATGEVEFADAIERALYNVVATSPSEDGRAFYYANTLHQRTPGEIAPADAVSKRALSSLRAPWFEVSCCPPNVARTLASLAAYVATTDEHGLQLHQYVPATIETVLPGSRRLRLRVETDYPRSGRIVIDVDEAPADGWRLSLRVPEWSFDGATLTTPGRDGEPVSPGVVTVDGPGAGDRVVLDLDLTPRFVRADPRVDAVRGCVAVQRGPEVWCLESVDLPGSSRPVDVARVRVDAEVAPRLVEGRVSVRARILPPYGDRAWPYGAESASETGQLVDVPLTPYHSWAQRGPSTMRVWIPTI